MIISFEGIDGSGKSTQVRRLLGRLKTLGYDTLSVREPGGTDVSERIRQLLLDDELTIDPFAEMLLFSAARAQLVRNVVTPFHRRGGVVICDRFFDSTIAYQGGGRKVADVAWLDRFQRVVTDGAIPDRTYLIRVSPDVARSRLAGRTGRDGADRMERAGALFFEDAVRAYDALARNEPDRFCVLDGSADEQSIETKIWEDLRDRLPEPPPGDPVDSS